MSSDETGQMSAVETGQISAAETGQMSSPNRNLSAPNRDLSVPNRNLFVPNRNLSVPNRNLSVPNRKLFVPNRNLSVPNRNLAVPNRNLSVPNRDLPCLNMSEVSTVAISHCSSLRKSVRPQIDENGPKWVQNGRQVLRIGPPASPGHFLASGTGPAAQNHQNVSQTPDQPPPGGPRADFGNPP